VIIPVLHSRILQPSSNKGTWTCWLNGLVTNYWCYNWRSTISCWNTGVCGACQLLRYTRELNSSSSQLFVCRCTCGHFPRGRYQRLPGNIATGGSRCAWNGKVEYRPLHHACVLQNNWTRDCHASVEDCIVCRVFGKLFRRTVISVRVRLWIRRKQSTQLRFLCFVKRHFSKFYFLIIIIIIIIIIFINCNWVVTRWQWLFYTYTKYEIGY
jgi:hypothetical protein